jgi:uncharacterized membrane protein
MPIILPIHIAGGVLALVFGYIALFAAKGSTLHRKSGTLFVFAMVAMSLTGALVAAVRNTPSSVVAGLLTFYFVTTGMLTVRRHMQASHWMHSVGVVYALTVGAIAFKSGLELMSRGRPETAPMFIFGVVAMLAAAGDIRMMRVHSTRVRLLRAGGVDGSGRIWRHLWRMCFAMWVAAASFFWGPRGRVPEIIYIPALLPIPVLTPVAVMLYWLWRLKRRRRTARSSSLASAHEPTLAKVSL